MKFCPKKQCVGVHLAREMLFPDFKGVVALGVRFLI
jgi:hypothetical protein